MSQNTDKTSDTASTVEVEKTNRQVWSEMVKKANIALRKIKNKKTKIAKKKTGT